MAYRRTKNPRIQFVPSDDLLALVNRIAKVSGQSRASICAEMLEEVVPVLRQQLDAFEKLAALPEQARELLARQADDAHRDIDAAVAAAMQRDLELPHVDGRKKGARRVAGT